MTDVSRDFPEADLPEGSDEVQKTVLAKSMLAGVAC